MSSYPATRVDMPRVLENLRELTIVEQRAEGREAVVASQEQLWAMLAGPRPTGEGATIVGHAWFAMFGGTFGGRPWLYVEDLYLDAAHRGGGVGRRVMAMLARLATDRGCAGLTWSVVKANAGAARFYERLGAELTTDSVQYSLSGEGLERLARDDSVCDQPGR